MKIINQIKQHISILPIIGLIILLVASPCKVRNSIQGVFEIQKTEVSNKSISHLQQSSCETFSETNSTLTAYNVSIDAFQITLNKSLQYYIGSIPLSDRPITQYYSARDEIPPLVPYYILFKNNKAYL